MSESTPPPPPSRVPRQPVTRRTSSNGLGLAALILGAIGILAGLVASAVWVAGILGLVGVILGFVGYSRFQSGDATDGTMALWGIITSAVAMVISIVGALTAVGLFGDGEEPSTETESTDTPAAAADDGYLVDLEVGDCLGESPAEEIVSIQTVPCSEPHSHEVFAEITLTEGDGQFPGYAAIDEQAEESCIAMFDDFVGLPYGESQLEFRFVTPSEEGWRNGERLAYCAVYDPAGEVSGSLRGAER